MKTNGWFLLLAAIVATEVATSFTASGALVVARWNFNSTTPDGSTITGTLTPSTGSGTASALGGVSTSFSDGTSSSDPAANTDDSAWALASFPTQGSGNRSAGVQFTVSTLGYENIVVQWDQRQTSTSSRYVRLLYTIDGSTWLDSTLFSDSQPTGTTVWNNGRSVDLSAISGVENNSLFAIRIVSEFAPSTTSYTASGIGDSYGGGGTWRFDMVTISGDVTAVPEPTNIALGIFAAGLLAFRFAKKLKWRKLKTEMLKT